MKIESSFRNHSVLHLWLVEKKFARYATLPIILFDIFPIEIWSQTNISIVAFWENPIFRIFISKSCLKSDPKISLIY